MNIRQNRPGLDVMLVRDRFAVAQSLSTGLAVRLHANFGRHKPPQRILPMPERKSLVALILMVLVLG